MSMNETKFGIFSILTFPYLNIVVDDWNMIEKLLSKWWLEIYNAQMFLQEMTNNVGLSYSVGETTQVVLN